MSAPGKDGPILRVAVSAVEDVDDARLQTALSEVASRDFRVIINTQHQGKSFSIAGKSKSDLESICDRLRDEYELVLNIGPFEAILLETFRTHAEAEGKYIRQTGGSGNYGHCRLRVDPREPGTGYEFVNDVKSGAVPSKFIQPIDQGVRSAMEDGILAGFPIADVKVTLCGGSYHETDSNEMAFKFAAAIAFKEAARRASPLLLEPMMAIEIEVVGERGEAIRNEIYRHRGRVERNLVANAVTRIKAVVPLSELLASASGNLAQFPMAFAGYEPVKDEGSASDGGTAVTANKPNGPRPRSQSATAQWTSETE